MSGVSRFTVYYLWLDGGDQKKRGGEGIVVREWDQAGHVHGIVQRPFQRVEWYFVLRCTEHLGVDESHQSAGGVQQKKEAFGAWEHRAIELF